MYKHVLVAVDLSDESEFPRKRFNSPGLLTAIAK